jgi:hypothetical protein
MIDGYSNEAGLYVVDDTTQPGSLAVTEIPSYSVGTVFGIPSGFTNEDLYYPTNIASMGQLPLIVISHGNGHNYQWYDHIGYHMASYGYIVMSHQNATGAGIDSCSLTTTGHTDAIISQHNHGKQQFIQAGGTGASACQQRRGLRIQNDEIRDDAKENKKIIDTFVILVIVLELSIILLYGVFSDYKSTPNDIQRYSKFTDINVMMNVGFGFLMSFLKK